MSVAQVEIKEEVINFTFDLNRNAPVNKKDTIKFMISDANGMTMKKSFIFNYISQVCMQVGRSDQT